MRERDLDPPLFPEGTPIETPEILFFIEKQKEREQIEAEAIGFDKTNLLDEWDLAYFTGMREMVDENDAILKEILFNEEIHRGIRVSCFTSFSKGRNKHGEKIRRTFPRIVILFKYSETTFEARGKRFQEVIDTIATEAFPEADPSGAVDKLKEFINNRIFWEDRLF